jgi:hypothetical protein
MMLRRVLLFLLFSSLLGSCVSVNKINQGQTVLRNPEKLRADVGYVQNKLRKFHPCLDDYISMKALDFKFDSLKTTLISPMTSNEFYFHISPVIAAVKQGHTRIFPLSNKLRSREINHAGTDGISPLFQYDFEMFDGKFYIVKNFTGNNIIKPATELIAVNNIRPQEVLLKYRNTLSSDGYNQTFIDRRLIKDFPTYYFYQYGVTDSVLCELKYNDSLSSVWLKRKTDTIGIKNNKTRKQKKSEWTERKKETEKKMEEGYNEITRTYSKKLSFLSPDSSIAMMKITDFSNGNYTKFYRESFHLLDSLKTNTMILDLRDNPGGRLSDASALYSYLADTSYKFIEKSEVTSNGFLHLLVNKSDDKKYYFPFPESSKNPCKPNHFKGKVYVLINGGTFSASCILSSNLKGSKRAVFVGEETGGAYNGTVAGIMKTVKLPESRLKVRFGLANIRPYYKSGTYGRGIFPDVKIRPTLEDRRKGIDTEVEYVLRKVTGDR